MGVALYAALASGQTSLGANGGQVVTESGVLSFDVSSESVAGGRSTSLSSPSTSSNLSSATSADPASPDPRLQALAAAATATPAPALSPSPTPTPTPKPEDRCERSTSSLYCIYTVQQGETLSGIAQAFNISGSAALPPAEILAQSNKPDVINSNAIVPGQKLRIPVESGIIHTVFGAETLSDLAASYGVSTASIQNVAANNITNANLLVIGANILVPNPAKLPAVASNEPTPTASPAATATATPVATATPESTPVPAEEETEASTDEAAEPETLEPPPLDEPAATATPATAATQTPVPATSTPKPAATTAPAATSRSGFAWPASGPISSYYGPSHPLGIDIDFYASPNQPVKAAAAGTVTFAGGDPCCSYGYYVIVDHGNGFTTLYAHFSSISVRQGQKVGQGEVLGAGGRTGYATGNHLHFEIRLNGSVVNPLNYLP